MTIPLPEVPDIDQPGGHPFTTDAPAEEDLDRAQMTEDLEDDPEEDKNLTDPSHEKDLSTGDA